MEKANKFLSGNYARARTYIRIQSLFLPFFFSFPFDTCNLDEFRYRCSEAQRELSDRLLAEATLACESAKEIVKSNKEETDHRLLEKLNDIEFRKEELLRIRKDSVLEIDALSVYKERITNALKSVKRNGLAICEKCLIARSLRFSRFRTTNFTFS